MFAEAELGEVAHMICEITSGRKDEPLARLPILVAYLFWTLTPRFKELIDFVERGHNDVPEDIHEKLFAEGRQRLETQNLIEIPYKAILGLLAKTPYS
jgi:hypothetical protein